MTHKGGLTAAMSKQTVRDGDIVRCLGGSIDKNRGRGKIGRISGFARFSAYHALEAHVIFNDGDCPSGWYWVSDLVPGSDTGDKQ